MRLRPTHLLILAISFFMTTNAFSIQYTFQPRVSASEEYTSNVFLSKDNEEDDWITTVSAGFTARALGKTGELEVSYDPGYRFYRDFDENDGWRHDARLHGFSNLTKRTRVDIRNTFLYTQDPLEEEDILALRDGQVVQEGDTTVRKGRRTYYRNTASTRVSNRFGKDDLVYAGFLYSFLRNRDPQEEDNDRYQPEAGLNYWFGPKFGIQTNATYTKGNFDQDSDFRGDGTSDFDNWAGTIRAVSRTKTRFSVFAQHFGHAFIVESFVVEREDTQPNKLAGPDEKVGQDGDENTFKLIRLEIMIHQALRTPFHLWQEWKQGPIKF